MSLLGNIRIPDVDISDALNHPSMRAQRDSYEPPLPMAVQRRRMIDDTPHDRPLPRNIAEAVRFRLPPSSIPSAVHFQLPGATPLLVPHGIDSWHEWYSR